MRLSGASPELPARRRIHYNKTERYAQQQRINNRRRYRPLRTSEHLGPLHQRPARIYECALQWIVGGRDNAASLGASMSVRLYELHHLDR